MGWREEVRTAVREGVFLDNGTIEVDMPGLMAALKDMPNEIKAALARELLAGTGRVVARNVPTKEQRRVKPWLNRPCDFVDFQAAAYGWNACRAAMMGEG